MADIDDPSDDEDEGGDPVWMHRDVPGMTEKDHDFDHHHLCLCGALVFTREETERLDFADRVQRAMRVTH